MNITTNKGTVSVSPIWEGDRYCVHAMIDDYGCQDEKKGFVITHKITGLNIPISFDNEKEASLFADLMDDDPRLDGVDMIQIVEGKPIVGDAFTETLSVLKKYCFAALGNDEGDRND